MQKEGANKGKEFFACPKPRDQSCGFFLWADQDQNEPPGHNTGVGGRRGGYQGGGRGGNQSNRGGYRAAGNTGGGTKRKCGHCREEGMWKIFILLSFCTTGILYFICLFFQNPSTQQPHSCCLTIRSKTWVTQVLLSQHVG